jgi:hypothetical protein
MSSISNHRYAAIASLVFGVNPSPKYQSLTDEEKRTLHSLDASNASEEQYKQFFDERIASQGASASTAQPYHAKFVSDHIMLQVLEQRFQVEQKHQLPFHLQTRQQWNMQVQDNQVMRHLLLLKVQDNHLLCKKRVVQVQT